MKRIITSLLAFATLFVVLAPVSTVAAKGAFDEACRGSSSVICEQKNGADRKVDNFVESLLELLFLVIGIVAVIMIIVGGLKYVTSNGDSNAITSAKNTILYSVVGLVIAMLAYAIVNFVVAQF